MDAQPNHEHKDASHAQKMNTGLKFDEKQEECRPSGRQKPCEKVKELVYVIIRDDFVQYHQKYDTADIERVFPFLDGGQENGTDHP